jgi:hypothetical protein
VSVLNYNLIDVLLIFYFRALIGELDEDLDSQIDLNNVRAAPLKPIAH